MRRHAIIKVLAIVLPMVVTTVLWVLSKGRHEGPWPESLPQLLSQITSLWAITLFSVAMFIVARSRGVERLYGGLDKSYRTHGVVARIGFVLMLAHPLLLIPHYMMTDVPVWKLFWYSDFWPRNAGITSFYLFLILVLMTVFRFLEYQRWLASHKLLGIAFLLAWVHTFNALSDVRAFEPLREWMAFIFVAGTASWLYKVFFYQWAAKQYRYTVQTHRDLGAGNYCLDLVPVRERMNFEPGEFVFISVKGSDTVGAEHHPFTVASDPVKRVLRLGYKAVGDYTRALATVKEGTAVTVYGPYGEFSSYMLDEYKRQIWIAGGVGITPFLAMLSHEARNEDRKEIWLYYCTKTAAEAVWDPEVRALAASDADQIHYRQAVESVEGFLTAEKVRAEVGDLTGVAVLVCGPRAMMRAMKRQFTALGVPASDVHFEEFDFV